MFGSQNFLDKLSECERYPKYFEIESADICNARCIMCKIGRNKENSSGNIMTMDLFENIVRQLYPHTDWIESVALIGRGESLLDKTLEQKIRKLREIGIKRVQVSTNAALLDEDRVMRMFESGLNDLRISIDSIRRGKAFSSIREKHLNNDRNTIPLCNGCIAWLESK